MLKLERVRVAYGARVAVREVSLTVEDGQAVAILGSNGAGKTSLLNAISGVVPSDGVISHSGRDLRGSSASERVRLGLIQCPQGRHLFPGMSVTENLLIGGYARTPRAERRRILDEIFDLFPRLRERARMPAGVLSGGEQQMVAVGRCLMARPTLLMLDEPSLGLSPRALEEMVEAIARIKRSGDMTIILVEQNVMAALEIGEKAYLLESGKLVGEGAPAALTREVDFQKVYLGG